MNDLEYQKDIEAKQTVYDKMCRYCERQCLEACFGVFYEHLACKKAKDEVNKIKENNL